MPQPGGIGVHAHNLAKQLNSHDYLVTVLTNFRSKTGEEERLFDVKQPYRVQRIKRHEFLVLTYLQRYVKAFQLARSNDVILVSGKFSIWIGGVLSLFSRKNIYAVVHGSEVAGSKGLKLKYTQWCLSRFTKVIAVSNYTKSLLRDSKVKEIGVIPNGFSISNTNLVADTVGDSIQLLTVGNVTQRKGQHNVIQALPQLLKIYPQLRYHIAGIPTEQKKLSNLAFSLGVKDAVIFHGKVTEEIKINLLKQATVFLMLSQPTLDGSVEGFGISILEANALGIPAVGSIGCGIEDAIAHNFSGKLVRHDIPKEIVLAVEDIVHNYATYSRNAFEWSQNFTWDTVIKNYLALLKA